MTQASISPVSPLERIQTIDIIRGFALLGVLIISFTVDDANVSPQEGWTGFGDQLLLAYQTNNGRSFPINLLFSFRSWVCLPDAKSRSPQFFFWSCLS